jgi:tRNA U34 2-thiouridine synthase MnmA/TrmU
MIAAAAADVRVFATGGVGGVHRGGEASLDVSADLVELGRTRVCVVCAGVKSLLDIPRTLEVLETHGVPVLALGAEAELRGLSVAQKPDSHDICFIPDGDTRGWLEERLGASDGPIIDTDGNELGTHVGAAGFTVGQRKGLDIKRPATDGRPRFVLEVRPATNTVIVGPKEALDLAEIAGNVFSWCGEEPADIDSGIEVDVQIRAHSDPVPARAVRVTTDAGIVEIVVRPDSPLNAVSPGQTAVLYAGTRVLGQFTIARTVAVRLSGPALVE